MAPFWNLMAILPRSWASSLTNLWNGSFLRRSSVDFWYLRISHRATIPCQYLWGFSCPCWVASNFFPLCFILVTPFFFFGCTVDCGGLQGALPLAGSFGWHQNQASSSLLGRGGGLLAFRIALCWFTSGA